MLGQLLSAGLLAASVSASFEGNINYGTPSRRHEFLAIDVPQIERRSWKRDNKDYKPQDLNFTHGIASGDPWPNSVILWTRVAPTAESSNSNATVEGTVQLYDHDNDKWTTPDHNPICVEWAVYKSDPSTGNRKDVVASNKAFTSSDIDYTVKVEATGLEPFTEYYYQFNVCDSNVKSNVGRTKTSPRPDDDVSKIQFAVFSCSNFPKGYFNAYGNAARKDTQDYNLHLGDYLYESGHHNAKRNGERDTLPQAEIFTLQDYRTRHGLYRSDADLQLMTERKAWITVWDDHEIADNGYKDGFAHLNNTEESFIKTGRRVAVDARKANAVRAYFEWIPIRVTDMDDGLRVWRSFQMGKLLDLIMLDTRHYDRSITDIYWNTHYIAEIANDQGRSLMGPRQESWFYRSLSDSSNRGAKWRVIGNQIVFSHIQNADGSQNGDAWDGYLANRNRTLEHLYDSKIGNNIFLSGDSHQNWVADLAWLENRPYDGNSGEGAIGVEFAGTGVSSSGPAGGIEKIGQGSQGNIDRNAELQWQEGYYRGYFLLDIGQDESTARFYGSPSVATRNGWDLPLANFTVKSGENHLQRPIGGGQVESGAVRGAQVKHSNLTLNTENGQWEVKGFDEMYLY